MHECRHDGEGSGAFAEETPEGLAPDEGVPPVGPAPLLPSSLPHHRVVKRYSDTIIAEVPDVELHGVDERPRLDAADRHLLVPGEVAAEVETAKADAEAVAIEAVKQSKQSRELCVKYGIF